MNEKVPVDHDSRDLDSVVADLLVRSVQDQAFPSASWVVTTQGRVVSSGAVGWAVVEPERIPAKRHTLFDVASLTKPVVTATLALRAVAEGRIQLGDCVAEILSELNSEGAEATWEDLLSHRAGLQAWYPLYIHGQSRAEYLAKLVRLPLAKPPRTSVVYSDLGYLLLQFAIERLRDASLDALAKEEIFAPLGMRDSQFCPPRGLRDRIAATERGNSVERTMVGERHLEFDGFRQDLIWGDVHDGNAWYLGGVAGHAGLFSTAEDLGRFGQRWLEGADFVIGLDLLARSIENSTPGLEENRGLGWQLRSEEPDHPAAPLSRRSFGHTGFTGSSLFVDPDRSLAMVLLTNRLHPTPREVDMRAVRRTFHRTVVDWWDHVGRDG